MEHSVPYTSQQNGMDERNNISLKEMATCLLNGKNLPPSLWEEAANCASYLQNREPHKLVVGANPFEALDEHKPNVSHLRVFGSKAWARISIDKRKAFQAQSSECILLGYAKDEKTYKLMELVTKKCSIEHDVQFEEYHLLDPLQSKAKGGINTLPFRFHDYSLSHVSYGDDD